MNYNPLLLSIAKEYIETIRTIAFGQGSMEEIRELEGQRAVLHEQLLTMLELKRNSENDMVQLAQAIILEARAEGWAE